jgi:hypothetical protein
MTAPFLRSTLHRALHRACYTATGLVLGAAMPALAQSPASVPAASAPPIQSLDKAQVEQERLKKLLTQQAPAYVDKVLNESALSELTANDEKDNLPQKEGVQTFLVETRVGASQLQTDNIRLKSSTELGLRTEMRLETRNYGELILQADTRQRSGTDPSINFAASEKRSGQRVTLRNIELPLTTQVLADTVVGHFSSEVTDALLRSYRLSLGGSAVQGLGVKVYDRDGSVQLGTGERGVLVGGPYPGFERTQGQLSWAGLSRRWGPPS